MPDASPNLIVIAGPNGSGKSTSAPALLRDYFGVTNYVNADVIAQGLAGFNPESVAMQAGRLMLHRMDELATARTNFAIETTLASRSYVPRILDLRSRGYRTHLVFFWLSSPEIAISRVAVRVSQGGHSVPEDVIRRRYDRSVYNLIHLYLPLMDTWRVYDHSAGDRRGVAFGVANQSSIIDARVWTSIQQIANETV
jgi:predicted ABC-type ATPase